MGAVSWNSIISPKIFIKTNISYSGYRVKDLQSFNNSINQGFKNKFESKVQEISLNSVWSFNLMRNWTLIGGLHLRHFIYTPYDYRVLGKENYYEVLSEEINNSSISLSNKFKFFKFIETELGARVGNYFLSNSKEFFIEPRFDINFNFNKLGVINFNYMQVSQASHLLISSGNIYVNEIWIPSCKDIPVSSSLQKSLSWSKGFYDNMFSLNIGVYDKELYNLITSEKMFTICQNSKTGNSR